MNHKSNLTYFNVGSILFLGLLLTFQSCKKSHSEIGKLIFKETRSKVFKQVETSVLIEKFKASYEKKKSSFRNPKFLAAFYEETDFEPILIAKNIDGGKLKAAVAMLAKANEHGINPETFEAKKLNDMVSRLYDKKALANVNEAYDLIVDLELTLANSLTNYSNALQFGLVSPRKIYAQYYIEVKRPDSLSFLKVFETNNIQTYLDSIQPKGSGYVALKKALKDGAVIPGLAGDDSQKVLRVNLERMRWNETPSEAKYVYVNIPDFSLDVMEDGKSTLNMKVCVGEGRDNGAKDLVEYDENDLKKDRKFNRETPQLKSLISYVQVNPVWNIPESIANNEIIKYAASDPYYLANKGIDVYLNGEKLEDPETLDFKAGDGSKYQFKQRPGDDNALGKIKFMFPNQSSVYLHDTPAQAAFSLTNRAVSHGCVRLEKPLDLAKALFGAGSKLTKIEAEMNAEDQSAQDVTLPKKIPVYISYRTCWVNEKGTIQYRKDIYGLDAVLYSYLQKIGE